MCPVFCNSFVNKIYFLKLKYYHVIFIFRCHGASKLTAVHELSASDISYKCNEFGKKKNIYIYIYIYIEIRCFRDISTYCLWRFNTPLYIQASQTAPWILFLTPLHPPPPHVACPAKWCIQWLSHCPDIPCSWIIRKYFYWFLDVSCSFYSSLNNMIHRW